MVRHFFRAECYDLLFAFVLLVRHSTECHPYQPRMFDVYALLLRQRYHPIQNLLVRLRAPSRYQILRIRHLITVEHIRLHRKQQMALHLITVLLPLVILQMSACNKKFRVIIIITIIITRLRLLPT